MPCQYVITDASAVRFHAQRGFTMSVARALLSTAIVPLLSGLCLAAEPDARKDPNAPISFCRDVRPIIVQNCQGCHQPAKPMGGFVMTSYADLLKAGEH